MEFNFSQLIILALLIEAIVTTIAWVAEAQFNWQRLTALAVAVALAVLAGIDLFVIIGLPLSLAFAGSVFTGLILARGANAIYDLFAAFKTIGNMATMPQSLKNHAFLLPSEKDDETEDTPV